MSTGSGGGGVGRGSGGGGAVKVDVDGLVGAGLPLGDGSTRVHVPEPVVKGVLDAFGVTTPVRRTGVTAAEAAAAATDLHGRLVLKAWGPGLVHKSDVGAVVVGIEPAAVATEAAAMVDRLRQQGIEPAGLLVEEQADAAVELIVGAVRRPGFGTVAVVGLGGTLTELVGDVAMRLCPLTVADVEAMLGEFRGAAVLAGARGGAPADRGALIELVMAVAGTGGLVEQLGDMFEEFECNPVRVSAKGAVALDARLVLEPAPSRPVRIPTADFDPFFHPRSVAVAGVSTSGKMTFGNRAVEAYREMGWTDGIHVVHPKADEVAGVPAVPSVNDIPGGVDYLLLAVPAPSVAPMLTEAAGHVRFAHVISGGFSEAGPEGGSLEASLLEAARSAGVRVVGPNCIGVYCPAGRQSFMLDVPREAGHVSVISQSGGLSGDIIKGGYQRGIRFSKVVAIGNAIDVTAGELLEYLLDDADTDVIGLYLEGSRDGERLVDAMRAAAGRKPVVALVGGLTGQGAAAVASHTGALAGDRQTWNAVSASTGTTVVTTLEELLGALTFLQRHAATAEGDDRRVLVLGVGGGSSVLATDACERAGLDVARVPDDIQADLRDRGFGMAGIISNPIEIHAGPLAPPDVWLQALDPVLTKDPYPDLLWHINVQTYFSYGGEGISVLLESMRLFGEERWPGVRISVVLRNLECAPPADALAITEGCAAAGLPSYRTLDEAALAIAAGKRFGTFRSRLAVAEHVRP